MAPTKKSTGSKNRCSPLQSFFSPPAPLLPSPSPPGKAKSSPKRAPASKAAKAPKKAAAPTEDSEDDHKAHHKKRRHAQVCTECGATHTQTHAQHTFSKPHQRWIDETTFKSMTGHGYQG